MANVKYRLSFKNIEQRQIVVELASELWNGGVTNVRGVGGEGLTISQIDEGDTPFESHLVKKSAEINVYSDAIDVDSLQMASDKDWFLSAYIDGDLKFKGFMVPDGIRNMRSGKGNSISITAVCGLSLLDKTFEYGDNYGTITVDGLESVQRCPMNFIRLIVKRQANMGNPLPIRWSCSLKASEYPDRDFFAGAVKWGDFEVLNEMQSLEGVTSELMLEGFMKSSQCWIVQEDGYWNITNYQDLIDKNGVLEYYVIPDTNLSVTAIVQEIDLNIDLNESGIENSAYSYYSKAVGKAVVTYKPIRNEENILPNGNLDIVNSFTQQPINWVFAGAGQSITSSSLNGREGSSVQLTATAQEGRYSLLNKLNIDASVLFDRMTFGFTIMPQYGFGGTGDIDFDEYPIKIRVSYTSELDGSINTFYLNEFGYWQDKPKGTDIGVNYMGTQFIEQGGGVGVTDHRAYFEGSPNFGDQLVIAARRNAGGSQFTYQATADALDVGDLESFLFKLRDSLNHSSVSSSKSVVMESTTRGYVQFRQLSQYGRSLGWTDKTGAVEDYQHIYIKPQAGRVNDIIPIVFTGKGGSDEMKMPDPFLLEDGMTEGGKFSISFFVAPNQRYTLDDIWMKVNDNQDVYEVKVDDDNSTQEYELSVSSSFSGFMLSNYMDNYGSAEKMMNYNSLTASNKRLTEMYGRAVTEMMGKPRMIYNGAFKTTYNSLSLSFVNVANRGFITVGYDYNVEQGKLERYKGFEGKIDSRVPSVLHRGKESLKK